MTKTYADWYSENKTALAERRRERYQNDPEYRARVLEQSNSYKKRSRLGLGAKPKSFETLLIEGMSLKAWRLSEASRKIGRTKTSINYWIEHGYMPASPLLCNRGKMLFTDSMIFVIKESLLKRGRLCKSNREGMFEEIRDGWEQIGAFSWEYKIDSCSIKDENKT